jgi:hypothetical protein
VSEVSEAFEGQPVTIFINVSISFFQGKNLVEFLQSTREPHLDMTLKFTPHFTELGVSGARGRQIKCHCTHIYDVYVVGVCWRRFFCPPFGTSLIGDIFNVGPCFGRSAITLSLLAQFSTA